MKVEEELTHGTEMIEYVWDLKILSRVSWWGYHK